MQEIGVLVDGHNILMTNAPEKCSMQKCLYITRKQNICLIRNGETSLIRLPFSTLPSTNSSFNMLSTNNM